MREPWATGAIGSQTTGGTPPRAVELAVSVIASHPRVARLSAPRATGTSGGFDVDVEVRLELPFSWMAQGRSPNGVQVVEPVTLSFPPSYPVRAPMVVLRADFDRSLAHVQPGPADGPVVPCLVYGDPDEFLHSHLGLLAVIGQLVVWLEKAAAGELIDPAHGWEPVRRDSLEDVIIADADHIRGLVPTSISTRAMLEGLAWRLEKRRRSS